jgi:hypothetical protein
VAEGDADYKQSDEARQLCRPVRYDVARGGRLEAAVPTDLEQQERSPPGAQRQRDGQGRRDEGAVDELRAGAVALHTGPRRLRQLGEQLVQIEALPAGEVVQRL